MRRPLQANYGIKHIARYVVCGLYAFRALHPSRRCEERMDSTFLCWNRLRLHAYTCAQSRNDFPRVYCAGKREARTDHPLS